MDLSFLKTKISLLSIGGVTCIAGFLVMGSAFSHSREEVIDKVKLSIETQDTKSFMDVLPSEAKSYPYAEIGIRSFLKEAEKHPKLVMDMMDSENTFNVDPKALKVRAEGLVPYEIIKDGKTWIFFDDYIVKPKKYRIELGSDLVKDKNVSLTLDGEKIDYSIFQKNFLPGKYNFAATKKYPWTTVSDKRTVTLYGKDSVKEVSFSLSGNTIDLSKDFIGAEILFKSKSTGIKVGDKNSEKFGPVNESDKKYINLKADFPWTKKNVAKIKTEETNSFGSRKSDEFAFEVEEKKGNEFYIQFLKEYSAASVKQSIEPYTTITDKYKNEEAKEYADNARFGFSSKYDFIKSYLNKETLKIVSSEEGYPVLEMEGLVLLHEQARLNSPEKDVCKSVKISALYDKDKKAWRVDKANIGYASQPNVDEESKYIITSEK